MENLQKFRLVDLHLGEFPQELTSILNSTVAHKTNMKLYHLESKLGISRSDIFKILLDEGYNVSKDGNFELKDNHIYTVAQAYKKSLKQLFKKVKKQVKTLDHVELLNHAYFFRMFVRNGDQYNSVNLFDQELDSELIENWVFRISNYPFCGLDLEEKYLQIFRDIQNNLKFKFKSFDLKIIVESLYAFFSHYYYTYPSEEDSQENLIQQGNFSGTLRMFSRKAIIDFLTIKAFDFEKYKIINRENPKLRLI